MNNTNTTINLLDLSINIAATVTDFICIIIFSIMSIVIVTTLMY
jgi:hypothetical protein